MAFSRDDELLAAFRRVETWIFDLDNTLYPAKSNLFAQVDRRMGAFIAELLDIAPEAARRVQKDYYHRFGTTLAGLMRMHRVAPERFLDYVHDIDLSPIEPAPALAAALARLPGRKFIFTNGSRSHAERVAGRLGVLEQFSDIFDIARGAYAPKPTPQAYHRFCDACRAAPETAAMFEDLPHNLEAPHALGMITVLVRSAYLDHPSQDGIAPGQALPAHIHHITEDLSAFLQSLEPVLSASSLTRAGPVGQQHKKSKLTLTTNRNEAGTTMTESVRGIIEEAFEKRDEIGPETGGVVREAVEQALNLLDSGAARVAEPTDEGWHVNQWLKMAVLLSFRLNDMMPISGGPGDACWWDKVPSKFAGWGEGEFRQAGFRAVPNCVVRHSAYIAPGVVLMPSFVNLGAYIDSGTMIDTWATVGSCAQIGKNVHLSGGAGIGGVLEPLQAGPVVIEDNCFIGARAEVAEGVIVREGSVLSMGVYIGASTKIIDRATGEVHMGEVPPYSVVVPGAMPGKPLPDGTPGPSLYCAVIVKRVDERTRAKTSINELLRD